MDWIAPDALNRTEAHLTMLSRGRDRQVLVRWRRRSPELAQADISTVGELKAWVHQLPTERAEGILRHLVTAAQTGDHVALLAVIVCLAPGIRSLAARATITCEEAVSEIALGVLDYPVERRSSVAAGLLLDARNRLHRNARRQSRNCPLDDSAVAAVHRPAVPDDPQEARPPAQRIVQLVCQAHREGILNRTDAQLILHTRIAGHRVQPIATDLGLSTTAAYQRRSRAEARLSELVA
jgi:DNA-directed RNA polymerase specialized sigma24 family protein